MMLSSIQALRFTAALLVLFFHMGLMQSGYKGVDLFFIISGFILYYNYNSRPSITQKLKQKFLIHRLTKIYLLYWTALIVLYLIEPFPFDLSLIGSLLLVPGHKPVLDISWSLSYELYFYALMGITLFYIPARWHKRLFFAAFVFTAGIKLFHTFCFSLKGTPLYFLGGPNLWEFLCGVLAGYVFCNAVPVNGKRPYLLFSLVLLILFWMLPISYNTFYYHFIYGSIATLLLLASMLAERKQQWNGWAKNWVIRLGSASYAMYLFGTMIRRIVIRTTLSGKIGASLILIIFSLFINIFYEERMLRIVRNFLEAKKRRSRTAGSRP
jgi:exopolysaccharide production protein ExoZ